MTGAPPSVFATPHLSTSVCVFAAGVAAALATVGYGILHPRAQVFGRIVYRAPASSVGRGVALTFDDGPTPGGTDRVLDALGELAVKATFFVVGRNVLAHPALVRRMDAEGHLVANHTFDHSHTACWGRGKFWRWEIGRADDAVAQVIGKRPALFRPPMGLKSIHTMWEAKRHGHTVATWSLRGLDTKPGASVEGILSRLLPAQAGDVLLLHDGVEPFAAPRDLLPTVNAVVPLVRALREKGLDPVRLDQLLGVAAYRDDQPRLRPFLDAPPPSKWA